jgi:hypothetical protein
MSKPKKSEEEEDINVLSSSVCNTIFFNLQAYYHVEVTVDAAVCFNQPLADFTPATHSVMWYAP